MNVWCVCVINQKLINLIAPSSVCNLLGAWTFYDQRVIFSCVHLLASMGDAGDGGNGDGYKNGGSEGSRKVYAVE